MSIGKSSALLAIDFVFGRDTYVKSDGVKQEGNHSIFFAFEFNGIRCYFERNIGDSDTFYICDNHYRRTDKTYTKTEFTNWLKVNYNMDFAVISFRKALSSFFKIYGKKNHDELNPLQEIPGQNMENSINVILTLFDKYKNIEVFKQSVDEHKNRLVAYNTARKYEFISNLVGGKEV